MKCPTCAASRQLKIHDTPEPIAVMVCPRCLATDKLPTPSRDDVLTYRAEVAEKLRHMGIAA